MTFYLIYKDSILATCDNAEAARVAAGEHIDKNGNGVELVVLGASKNYPVEYTEPQPAQVKLKGHRPRKSAEA
jgi:hypothetical protein